MAEIIWSEEASANLLDIHDYIAVENPDAADRVVSGIHRRVEMLTELPGMGPPVRGHEGVRALLFGHYRIFYTHEGVIVTILGVYHTARDIDRLL